MNRKAQKTAAALRPRRFNLIVLFAILAGRFRFLTALDAGTLVVLTLTHLGQNTGLGAAAFKPLQSALQRLVFSHTNFRHLYFPPSGAAGQHPPRKGHHYGFNVAIIFIFLTYVKGRFMNSLLMFTTASNRALSADSAYFPPWHRQRPLCSAGVSSVRRLRGRCERPFSCSGAALPRLTAFNCNTM